MKLIFIKIKAPVGPLKLNKQIKTTVSDVLHNKQNLHGERNLWSDWLALFSLRNMSHQYVNYDLNSHPNEGTICVCKKTTINLHEVIKYFQKYVHGYLKGGALFQ